MATRYGGLHPVSSVNPITGVPNPSWESRQASAVAARSDARAELPFFVARQPGQPAYQPPPPRPLRQSYEDSLARPTSSHQQPSTLVMHLADRDAKLGVPISDECVLAKPRTPAQASVVHMHTPPPWGTTDLVISNPGPARAHVGGPAMHATTSSIAHEHTLEKQVEIIRAALAADKLLDASSSTSAQKALNHSLHQLHSSVRLDHLREERREEGLMTPARITQPDYFALSLPSVPPHGQQVLPKTFSFGGAHGGSHNRSKSLGRLSSSSRSHSRRNSLPGHGHGHGGDSMASLMQQSHLFSDDSASSSPRAAGARSRSAAAPTNRRISAVERAKNTGSSVVLAHPSDYVAADVGTTRSALKKVRQGVAQALNADYDRPITLSQAISTRESRVPSAYTSRATSGSATPVHHHLHPPPQRHPTGWADEAPVYGDAVAQTHERNLSNFIEATAASSSSSANGIDNTNAPSGSRTPASASSSSSFMERDGAWGPNSLYVQQQLAQLEAEELRSQRQESGTQSRREVLALALPTASAAAAGDVSSRIGTPRPVRSIPASGAQTPSRSGAQTPRSSHISRSHTPRPLLQQPPQQQPQSQHHSQQPSQPATPRTLITHQQSFSSPSSQQQVRPQSASGASRSSSASRPATTAAGGGGGRVVNSNDMAPAGRPSYVLVPSSTSPAPAPFATSSSSSPSPRPASASAAAAGVRTPVSTTTLNNRTNANVAAVSGFAAAAGWTLSPPPASSAKLGASASASGTATPRRSTAAAAAGISSSPSAATAARTSQIEALQSQLARLQTELRSIHSEASSGLSTPALSSRTPARLGATVATTTNTTTATSPNTTSTNPSSYLFDALPLGGMLVSSTLGNSNTRFLAQSPASSSSSTPPSARINGFGSKSIRGINGDGISVAAPLDPNQLVDSRPAAGTLTKKHRGVSVANPVDSSPYSIAHPPAPPVRGAHAASVAAQALSFREGGSVASIEAEHAPRNCRKPVAKAPFVHPDDEAATVEAKQQHPEQLQVFQSTTDDSGSLHAGGPLLYERYAQMPGGQRTQRAPGVRNDAHQLQAFSGFALPEPKSKPKSPAALRLWKV